MPAKAKSPKDYRLGLSPRQHLFVLAYLKEPNGTKAAIEAGYTAKFAAVTAATLLRNPKVSKALIRRTEILTQTAQLTAEDVIREFMRVAFADRTQAYNPDGNLKPIDEWPEDVRRCFNGMTSDKHGNPAAQFEARLPALNSLARHLPGFFKDKLEVTGKDGTPLTIVQVKNFLMQISGTGTDNAIEHDECRSQPSLDMTSSAKLR